MPCDCTFTAHLGRQAIAKTAGKLHDFLMNPKSRPDLQTPEGQRWLKMLARMHELVGDKLDPLTPWLTREWKKGRILQSEDGEIGHPYYRWIPPDEPETFHRQPLTQRELSHWADFYGTNHPLRRELGDIMAHHVQPFHDRVKAWDEAMRQQALDQSLQGGEIVHQWPDAWTLRKLTTPDELSAEGDAMGHCVGGYCGDVQSGRSLIYSLRDPEGRPHVTTEISPGHVTSGLPNPHWLEEYLTQEPTDPMHRALQITPETAQGLREYERQMLEMREGMRQKYDPEPLNYQGLYNELAAQRVDGRRRDELPLVAHPENGHVVQIQGKGNQDPIDEYKARLADWFRTFPPETRPTRVADEEPYLRDDEGYVHSRLDHPDLIPVHERELGGLTPPREPVEDEYGLIRQTGGMLPADYDDLLRNIGFNDYGYHSTPDSDHIQDIYRLAKERGELSHLAEALQGYQEDQDSNFQNWMDQNYEYAPMYPDEPAGWENEDGEEAGEGDDGARPYWQISGNRHADRFYDPAEAEKAYDEEYAEWERQHPGMNAVSQMWGLLQPHYHPEGWAMTEHGPKSPGYYTPIYNKEMGQLGPGEWEQYLQTGQPPQQTPPTIAKVAMPIIPTKWDALRQPRDEYVGEFPTYPDPEDRAVSSPAYTAWLESVRPEIDAHRQRGEEWDRAARNAMATGRMTPEEVTNLGYSPTNHETDGDWGAPKWGRWRPLPEKLYHVTTNVPAIAASGVLRSPYELDLNGKGRGLGGGTQDTISLTDSPEEAENIKRAILEGADVASGRLPIERLVEMAERGEGADKPWLRTIFGNYDWSQGNPRALDDLLLGRKPFYRHLLPDDHPLQNDHGRSGMDFRTAEEWAQHGYYPYPGIEGMGHPDGPLYNAHSVYRNLTPEEKAHQAFEWWRNPWAPMRGWAGGPSDPLFTSVDPEWFAKLDPSHVGIIEAAPVPGAHGYPLASLGEWRIPTGEAVNITGINGQPYVPRTAKVSSITSKPLYKRWVFSPASGQVVLADNTGDPLDVRYHTDLARQLNEPNLVHGYAYPIDGGWRLTDWEHQPVSDPYVIAQVMGQLRAANAPSGPQDASWAPSDEDADWERVHHGLPG